MRNLLQPPIRSVFKWMIAATRLLPCRSPGTPSKVDWLKVWSFVSAVLVAFFGLRSVCPPLPGPPVCRPLASLVHFPPSSVLLCCWIHPLRTFWRCGEAMETFLWAWLHCGTAPKGEGISGMVLRRGHKQEFVIRESSEHVVLYCS